MSYTLHRCTVIPKFPGRPGAGRPLGPRTSETDIPGTRWCYRDCICGNAAAAPTLSRRRDDSPDTRVRPRAARFSGEDSRSAVYATPRRRANHGANAHLHTRTLTGPTGGSRIISTVTYGNVDHPDPHRRDRSRFSRRVYLAFRVPRAGAQARPGFSFDSYRSTCVFRRIDARPPDAPTVTR